MTQMSGGSIPSFQHSSDTNSNDESSLESEESKGVSMEDLDFNAKDVSVATHLFGNEPSI
jgi:hypothetical protein